MNKIILNLFFLLAIITGGNAQCIEQDMYPSDVVISSNLGIPQIISTDNYTAEYAEIDAIIPEEDYVFTCQRIDPDNEANIQDKYITVTDLLNNVIAYGPSPLTVTAISTDKIRVHFSDNASCDNTFESHKTTLQIVLTCLSPLNPIVSGITTSSANFTWSTGGSETAWQVLVLPSDATPPTLATTGTAVTTAAYTYSALSPGISYKFYVRSDCGSEFSPWNSLAFASACVPIAAFNESFDGDISSNLPVCWSSILRGDTLSEYAYVELSDEGAHSAPNSVELYNDGSDTSGSDDIILVSPNLSSLSGGTYRLKFYAKNAGSIQVGTLNGNSNTADFNLIEEIGTTDTLTQYTVNFSNYTGTDNYIGIRMNFSDYGSVYLDDILWEPIPTCPDVTDITIPSTTPSGANIQWIAGSSETSWDIAVGPVSTNDPGSLIPLSSTDSTKEISGLSDNTQYKIWVRSVCAGSDNGAWIGPVIFRTDCLAATTLNEDFDTAESPNLPSCWTSILRGETLSESAYIETQNVDYAHSSPNAVEFYKSGSNTQGGDDIILVSPNLSSLGLGTYRLKFYARGDQSNIQIGTLDSNTSSASFNYIEEIALNNTMSQYIIDFSSYTGTDRYIGIRMNSGEDEGYELYIDDIIWEPAPSCPDVTDVNIASVTTTSATIEWLSGGSETSWDIAVGAPNVTDPSTLTFVSSSSLSKEVTGLTESTNYKAWVRSSCDINDKGSWIGPFRFRTDCIGMATFYENFDSTSVPDLPSCWTSILSGPTLSESAYIETDTSPFVHTQPNSIVLANSDSNVNGGDDIILVSPNLSSLLNGGNRLKFYAKGAGGGLQIGTISSNTNSSTFNLIDEITTTATPTQYTIDFSSYTGPDRYIGIRLNSTETYTNVNIDDILWEVSPTCADVTDVTIASISPDGAVINWTEGGPEESWEIVVGAGSVTDPNTLPLLTSTVTTKSITGLETSSPYKLWVRSVCAGNDKGAWIGPVEFRTDCTPIAVFNEDFDNVETPDLPSCWTKIIKGATTTEYDAIETVFESVHSEPKSVGLYTDESSPALGDYIILVSPNLSTLGNGTHRLKFYAKGTGSIQVGTLDSSTSAGTFNLIEEFTTTNTPTLYKANFTSYTGTDHYIGIRLNNEENYSAVYIDDVIWEIAPLCADVEDLSLTNFTTTTADIDWSAGGNEGSWQIVYSDASVTNPDTLTPQPAITTTNATIAGLTAGITYNVWVRSVCGNTNGAWIGPLEFSTACTAITIASSTTEGFDTTPTGSLPVCWYGNVVSGEENWRTYTPTFFGDISNAHSGTKLVYKPYSNSDAVLYSLPFDYTSVTAPTRVNTYLHRQEFAASTDKYVIYANTSPSLLGAVQILEIHSLTTEEPIASSTGFYNYMADIPTSFNGASQVYIIIEGVTSEDWESFGLGMDDFKVEFSGPLAVPDFDKNDFTYYPNPVKNILNLDSGIPILAVTIFNILGQKVIDTSDINTNTAKIDMSELPSGNYIVKIISDNRTRTMKVIKQ